MMKVFVTGGTGFLGNHLVKKLLKEGYQVKTLVRSISKAKEILGSTDAIFVQGDMANVDAFADELKDCELLFHTAAYFRESFLYGSHWEELEKINITNTLRLFEYAKKYNVQRIFHTSSNNTIQKRKDNKPSTELDLKKLEDAKTLYAKSKIIGDKLIGDFSKQQSIPVITFLPGWMMGPVDAGPTTGGRYILDYLNKQIPGNVNGSIDIVDVRDVADAMVAAITKVNQTDRFLVTGNHFHLRELSHHLEKASGIPSPKLTIPKPVAFTLAWFIDRMAAITKKEMSISVNGVHEVTEGRVCNNTKAINSLAISYRPLHVTLQDSVSWYKEHRSELLTVPISPQPEKQSS
ncbi:NAD-dependent epimerase/dehydratase family protein [Gracilibacillus massiliensis]|uniref:NAD-dependent epimerase/dehydratase family protein n=1 Tax=Gracilibacillus massiliensis TaxID=1564956 RepID=UPI0009E9C39D|nr:NAD-dependent epimerase/dehydratase family protein [Gracilibacillus massiliensis]